jgi:hypothetical protein
VSLLLTFLILAFALIILFWGGSMFLQGWLYQNPAERMGLRAAGAGTAVAVFLTFWCWLDVKNPGKYGGLLDFSTTEITDYDEFVSVRKFADGKEEKVTYKKKHGSQGLASDFIGPDNKSWTRSSANYMVVAILIKEPNKEELTRYNANLVKAKRNGKDVEEFPDDLRYIEEKGSRFMSGDTPARVHRKKTGALLGNLLLNGLHFVVWWMAFWLGVHFAIWHAFGFAFVMWGFTMLAVQPVLFGLNRPADAVVTDARMSFPADFAMNHPGEDPTSSDPRLPHGGVPGTM